jgi:hypothetical protein
VLALALDRAGAPGGASGADAAKGAPAPALGGPGAAALPRAERARSLSSLIRAARDPVPAGIERVHPGWLRAALESEATEILLAITDGLPAVVREVAREIVAARGDDGATPPPALVAADRLAELRRVAFSSLVAMPGASAGAARRDAPAWWRLAALPVEALVDEIARAGAEALGTSLAGAPRGVVARAAARSGDRALADAVLEAARRAPAERERAIARAAVAAAGGLAGASALGPAHAVGLTILGQRLALESDEVVRVIAQRLPPAMGTTLLDASRIHTDINREEQRNRGTRNQDPHS